MQKGVFFFKKKDTGFENPFLTLKKNAYLYLFCNFLSTQEKSESSFQTALPSIVFSEPISVDCHLLKIPRRNLIVSQNMNLFPHPL